MRSQVIEHWIGSYGLPWRYEEAVPWTAFDDMTSNRNQARLGTIKIQEAVDRYALALIDGEKFPAVIAWQGAEGLVLIDGIQRREAAKLAEILSWDVYVVESKDAVLLDCMTRAANARIGFRQTAEESLAHAKEWTRRWGQPAAEAARRFNLNRSTVQSALRIDEIRGEAARLEIAVDGITPSTLYRLGALLKYPGAFVKAVEVVRTKGLKTGHVDELFHELSPLRGEAPVLRAIERFASREDILQQGARTQYGQPRPQRPRYSRLMTLVTSLHQHLTTYPTAAALELHAREEVERFARLVAEIAGKTRIMTRQYENVAPLSNAGTAMLDPLVSAALSHVKRS